MLPVFDSVSLSTGAHLNAHDELRFHGNTNEFPTISITTNVVS